MKYIKFVMRDGKQHSLSMDRAEKVLNSTQTLIKILDSRGYWTGESINKSEIVDTFPDIEREREEIIKLGQPQLDPPLTPEQEAENVKRWKNLRKEAEKIGIISKKL